MSTHNIENVIVDKSNENKLFIILNVNLLCSIYIFTPSHLISNSFTITIVFDNIKRGYRGELIFGTTTPRLKKFIFFFDHSMIFISDGENHPTIYMFLVYLLRSSVTICFSSIWIGNGILIFANISILLSDNSNFL